MSASGRACPPAYERALSCRAALIDRCEICYEHIKSKGRSGALRSFRAILSGGRAAINMPIAGVVRFIEEGSYLSIYEFVSRETGLTGDNLEHAVLERLKEFGPQRLRLDRLFQFRHDTHYASLNLGGASARRYGPCCVIFDLCHWAPFHTCFAGDSIRACFNSRREALDDYRVLQSFAIGEDAERLLVIRHEKFLCRQEHCVDPAEVRDIVEAEDSMIELHLHGPITRDRIREIRLSRSDYRHIRDLHERAEDLVEPRPWEFDSVEPFRKMMKLLDRYEIPLVLAEGG